MSSVTNIVILHKTKFGDSSFIIHGYSSHHGRCGFILKKSGRATALSQLHPLSVIEAEISEKSKGELIFINNFRALYPLQGIRESVSKSAVAIYISELLYRSVREYGPSPGFFSFLVKSILLLDGLSDDYANFHIWFLVELSKEAGYAPERNYREGSLFDMVSASFTDTPHPGSKYFTRESSALLAAILSERQESIHTIKLSGSKRGQFAREMTQYLSYHLGFTLNIRSLDVLHTVFE